MGKYVDYDRLEAIIIARQYKSKTQFRLENKALYSYATKRDWWPEMSAFMDKRVYSIHWTEEKIRDSARQYTVKVKWQKEMPGAYNAAQKLGIVIEVCAHMKRRLSPSERANGRSCAKCKKFTKPEDIAARSAICRWCHSKRGSAYAKANPEWKTAMVARRRARLLRAIPKWQSRADIKLIQSFYTEARRKSKETGIPYEVDHILPLVGKNVCGLHVPRNLQVITKVENRQKSNKQLFA